MSLGWEDQRTGRLLAAPAWGWRGDWGADVFGGERVGVGRWKGKGMWDVRIVGWDGVRGANSH